MAGLFDLFKADEQGTGLLGAGSAMLDASGPSLIPRSFGQILAAGSRGMQQAQDRQLQLAQARQMAELNGYKLKDAKSDYENQEALRQRQEELRQFYKNYGQGGQPQPGGAMPAAQMGGGEFVRAASNAGLPGDNGTLNQIVDGVNRGLTPQAAAAGIGGQQPNQPAGASSGSGNQGNPIYGQRMKMAEDLRRAGFSTEADAQEAAALKFQPKVKGWEKVQQGGKVLFAPFFEDGTSGAPVPLEVAEKLEFKSTGGKTLGLNPFTGAQVASFTNTASPDAVLSSNTTMRGQNLTDARARDQLQQGKVPAGYRLAADGKSLEAIPGGPAADKVTSPQQKAADAKDVIAMLDQAIPLLKESTGSYGGAAYDQSARFFGKSTDGAQAAAQLKVLEGNLVSKMPKMSGPQSDKDVAMYKQMAGVIGDSTIPYETKKAAMATIREIAQRNAGAAPKPPTAPSAAADIPLGARNALKMNPKLRAQFDEKYGPGAAASILGK